MTKPEPLFLCVTAGYVAFAQRLYTAAQRTSNFCRSLAMQAVLAHFLYQRGTPNM